MHKTHDVFQKIRERQIVGMMLHQQSADYFDFLDLHGFKRQQEFLFYMEAAGERRTSRYYVNHMGEIMDGGHPGNPGLIPTAWSGRNRREVGKTNRPEYVKAAITKWVSWEQETKTLYESAYRELMEMGEVAAAEYVSTLVHGVSHELKMAERLHLKLDGMGYDMPTIFEMQQEMHDKYKKCIRKIGKRLC